MSDRELSYEIIKHFDAFFDANIDASTVLLSHVATPIPLKMTASSKPIFGTRWIP